MGTSLSGLTPATTFDGLLKVGDNDPLTADLKAISDGSGNDSAIQLSTSELKVMGQFNVDTDTATTEINLRGDGLNINQVYQANEVTYNTIQMINSSGIRLKNGTGTALLARGGNIGIGGITTTPTARLQVKGSGATSATTSLLVQNSVGSDMFKVVDDNTMFYHTHKFRSAGGYLYIEGEGNADRSLKVGQNFTASSYDGHIFKTYDGAAYTEAMRITGANDQFVGIGETTPTARLHVKAGTTQDTIARFQDPLNASTYIDIKNDSVLTDYVGLFWGSKAKIRSKEVGPIFFDVSQAVVFADGNAAKTKIYSNGSMSIGASTIPSSTMAYIKGSGATSATTALLVQNSAGTELMSVDDDGAVRANSIKGINYQNNHLSLGANAEFLNFVSIKAPKIGVNGAVPTDTQAYIKGSGNDATTTALLVQNSDAADILKVTDDGALQINSDATQRFTIANAAGTAQLNFRYNNIYTSGGNFLFLGGAQTIIQGDGAQRIIVASTGTKIKGSGNDATTTTLLVQNSDGADMLKILDDRSIETYDATGNIIAKNNADNRRFEINPDLNSVVDFQVGGGGLSNLIRTDSGLNSVGIGTGGLASTRLVVKGSGATSATTALLVQNSAGTRIMEAQDGGNIFFGASASHYLQNGYNWFGSYYFLNTQTFRGALQNDLGSVKISDDLNVGGNADNDTGVRLQVKGSGATSATTALLVQNSAGTDLLKVEDGGAATFSGNTSSIRFYTNLGFYHSSNSNNVLSPNSTTGWVLQTANATGNIQVKNINVTASKETTAALQVDSTTQGFLPPRMTDAERDAITNPAAGLMIYDTSNNQMNYWNGSTWIAF